MKNELLKKYLSKLQNASTNEEINSVLDEIIPVLKSAGISIPEILMFFKMNGDDAIPKSQDHQNSISNSNKAQIVLQLLLTKLNK